jgi:hypothetical protein
MVRDVRHALGVSRPRCRGLYTATAGSVRRCASGSWHVCRSRNGTFTPTVNAPRLTMGEPILAALDYGAGPDFLAAASLGH